ncbi:MAG: ComF family protein [Candidatus Rokubacteria bacterium]|nr:ComF family protein [Candidatus Rokubacteria bacterium]
MPPFCRTCGRPLPSFEPAPPPERSPCEPCRRRPPPFAYARAAALYGERVREALFCLKFGGMTAMARPLGDLMAEAGSAVVPVSEIDCLVPVPLHPSREAERGFNQARLLARRVSRRWGVPVEAKALRRQRSTLSQTDLDAEERRENVKGAFALRRPGVIAERHVLLIDDVFTTGATVSECARVLLAGGAAAVGVLTIARVP